jgi:hypothetical protein
MPASVGRARSRPTHVRAGTASVLRWARSGSRWMGGSQTVGGRPVGLSTRTTTSGPSRQPTSSTPRLSGRLAMHVYSPCLQTRCGVVAWARPRVRRSVACRVVIGSSIPVAVLLWGTEGARPLPPELEARGDAWGRLRLGDATRPHPGAPETRGGCCTLLLYRLLLAEGANPLRPGLCTCSNRRWIGKAINEVQWLLLLELSGARRAFEVDAALRCSRTSLGGLSAAGGASGL